METIGSGRWRFVAAPRDRHVTVRSRHPINSAAVAVRSESQSNRMFVFGLGFVGRYVSDRLKKEGWQVAGTCTSPIKQRELQEMGFDTSIFDANKSKLENLPNLENATHLLISIPPIVGVGDPLLFSNEDLQRRLSYGKLQWLCYLSSTSVYGDCGGALVCEDYPVYPKGGSAKSRLAAEKGWLDLGLELGVPVYILRLGGIYGLGRSALDTIIKQKSMSEKQTMRKSRLYTARVHVADIYQAIKASFNRPSTGEMYNVVDDDPAPRAQVFAFARALIQSKWPELIGEVQEGDFEDLDSKQLKLNLENAEKRVSNARLKKLLGVNLIHPSYRSGLESILEEKRRLGSMLHT